MESMDVRISVLNGDLMNKFTAVQKGFVAPQLSVILRSSQTQNKCIQFCLNLNNRAHERVRDFLTSGAGPDHSKI